MPNIDWTPGQGRRGRPVRRVLGMGQRQGLLVMYGLAVVAILFAMAAACGAFGGSGPKPAGDKADGTSNAGGLISGTPSIPPDASKTTKLLLGSVQHYADLLATGQKIVGHTHYADLAAYSRAFGDPSSPAAQFTKFRTSPNPESDTSYIDVERQAAGSYGGSHGGTLDKWMNTMAKVKSDLGDWLATAAQYQRGAASQSALDAAASLVTQDLAAATATADSLSG